MSQIERSHNRQKKEGGISSVEMRQRLGINNKYLDPNYPVVRPETSKSHQ
jgi:hypothetical protein